MSAERQWVGINVYFLPFVLLRVWLHKKRHLRSFDWIPVGDDDRKVMPFIPASQQVFAIALIIER